MTAALSHLTGLKEDGLVEMARGAAAAGALTLVGMTQAEQYAAIAATGAPLVRIVKPFADEDKVMAQLRQAEELGAVAVGMDVDHIFDRNGEYDVVFGEAMAPRAGTTLRGTARPPACRSLSKACCTRRRRRCASRRVWAASWSRTTTGWCPRRSRR